MRILTNTPTSQTATGIEHKAVSPWLTLLLATACGLTAANIYYARPLAGPISAALGLSAEAAGLIVTLTQIGYGLGLLLIVPMGDLVENRRLTLILLGIAVLALTGAGLPVRKPVGQLRYSALLSSMVRLVYNTPVLRRRALYHAGLFAAFSLFWTTTPLLLAGPEFQLSQGGIALFALAGVAGAIAAPIAGRMADRGWSRPATGLAMLVVAVVFLITHIATPGSSWALGLLVAAAIVLDFGVSANMTLGQRAIFGLSAEFRARLNGLYMTTFFIGGAIGSALGGWAYAQGGWGLASWISKACHFLDARSHADAPKHLDLPFWLQGFRSPVGASLPLQRLCAPQQRMSISSQLTTSHANYHLVGMVI